MDRQPIPLRLAVRYLLHSDNSKRRGAQEAVTARRHIVAWQARTWVATAATSTGAVGPSEFHCTGSAGGWSVTGRLGEIGNPVLIVSGRHDEAGLPLQATQLSGLTTAELTVFGDSSHMPHWRSGTAT